MAEMSEAGRLAGVFTSPSAAFTDIAERPRWIVPLLIGIVCSIVFIWVFTQRVGWDRFVNTNLANNPRIEQLDPEQKARVLEQQRKVLPIMGWVAPVVFTPVMMALTALVFLGVFNLAMGAAFKFKNLFAIVCYAWLPLALHGLLGVGVMYLKDPDDFNLEKPTAFNLGAFLSPDSTPKWLQSLGGSIDLFVIWVVVLMALGIHCLDRKRSFASCLVGVGIPWLIVILCKAGWAAMFG